MASDTVEYPCAACGAVNRIPRRRILDDPKCGACGAKVFPRRPVEATDATFGAEVMDSPIPVLVDYWADWCAPCRMMAPVLEEVARELGGRVKIVKLDVDRNPSTAARYGITSIPALKVFQAGRVIDEVAGAIPKSQLLARLRRAVPAIEPQPRA